MFWDVAQRTRSARAAGAGAALLAVTTGCFINCSSGTAAKPSSRVVRLSSGDAGPFSQQLVAAYVHGNSDLDVRLVQRPNLDALINGDAEVTILTDDSLYFSYRMLLRGDPAIPDRVRAIAALHELPVHFLVSEKSRARTLNDLRGATVAFTPLRLHEFVLAAANIASSITRMPARSHRHASQLLTDGVADAALITSYYPVDSVEDALQQGARLLPIEGSDVERMLREHRSIRHINIPADTYSRYAKPIHTVGVRTVYVCRRDLDETVVYQLTKHLFEALPHLSRNFPGLRRLDVEHAPATPIPLHEGAARYYRELELFR